MNVKNSLKLLVVLSLLAFSTAVAAQPVSSFHVFVEKQASNYFFSVQGENVASTRVEVLGLNGRPIFDSGWILGQTVAWPLMTLNGQPAANGVYLYAISVRDQQGKEQRKLGKLAIVHGLEAMLGTPDISEISRIEPSALPAGVKWQEKLGKDSVDNFRIQRRPGNGQPFQDLLTLDNAGKLSVAQLCLSGVCFASWPSGGGGTFTLADGSVTLAKLVNQSCTAGNAIQGWTNGTLNCVSIGGGGGGGSAWLLTGNAGTNPSTNFLGTTDNVALAFRTNNQEQMRINETGSVGIGTTVFPNGLGRVLSVASTVLDGGGVTVGGSGASEVLYLYANTSLNYGGIQVKRPTVAFDNLVLQEQGGNVGIG
ncbi:hypothetical protein HY009_01310, partial [Candidatus Acetothermia bacterium]|nr:hypothetical protein [Candidatus Acetothermia bacterium]